MFAQINKDFLILFDLRVFLKGKFTKLQYSLVIYEASIASIDNRVAVPDGRTVYNGRSLLGSKYARRTYVGYFNYHFLDDESNFLPYKVGTYLGGKKVFNVGAGFFLHSKGVVVDSGSAATPNIMGEDVSIFAVDAFYDAPIGNDGSTISVYAVYQNNNYGTNYLFSAYGTGNMLYSHVGYVIKGDKLKTRYQPYVIYGSNSYGAVYDSRNTFGIGVNEFMSWHHSKLTLEYKSEKYVTNTNTIYLQAMIYL